MAVKFQSEEWAKEVTNSIQGNESVLNAAKGQNATVQMVTTGAPDGERKTYLKISEGVPEVGVGDVENPDATITQDFETAVALDKGEMQLANAYMQGKVKIQGNLMKMMQLQGFGQSIGPATTSIEREYN